MFLVYCFKYTKNYNLSMKKIVLFFGIFVAEIALSKLPPSYLDYREKFFLLNNIKSKELRCGFAEKSWPTIVESVVKRLKQLKNITLDQSFTTAEIIYTQTSGLGLSNPIVKFNYLDKKPDPKIVRDLNEFSEKLVTKNKVEISALLLLVFNELMLPEKRMVGGENVKLVDYKSKPFEQIRYQRNNTEYHEAIHGLNLVRTYKLGDSEVRDYLTFKKINNKFFIENIMMPRTYFDKMDLVSVSIEYQDVSSVKFPRRVKIKSFTSDLNVENIDLDFVFINCELK